jgi:glycosyltransferase involved in cell wall biosynthesis
VVAVSHRTAAAVETFTGGVVRPQVILNGVDLKRLELGRDFHPQSKRQALGINEDELVLITVAALNRHKDHRTLFHAFAEVLCSYGDARMLVVGDGRDRAELQELVSRLGIRKRVMFLGCRSDVHELLALADIFVLSTHTEGFPISVIEACCVGIPTVATEVGGLADFHHLGLGVLLTECENVDALRDALLSLLDPQRREHLGRRLREQARLLFDIGRTADHYRSVYRDLLAGNRSCREAA